MTACRVESRDQNLRKKNIEKKSLYYYLHDYFIYILKMKFNIIENLWKIYSSNILLSFYSKLR